MAVFQRESGSCTNRGFVGIDVDGYLAKFYTWITKAPAAGGPGWTILLDKSANPTPITLTSVDIGTEIFTKVNHGFYTADYVMYNTTGTDIGGIYNNSSYYVRKIDNDTFYLYSSLLNATTTASSPIDITSTGSGTHTFTTRSPYIIIAPTTPSGPNAVEKIIKIGYLTDSPGYVYVNYYLSWDDITKTPRGVWAGYKVNTVDAGDFAYDFRGGDECMFLAARISVTWSYSAIDEWEGIANYVEGPGVIGELQSNISTGTDVVVQLDTGEASLFTVNNWYFIYDFQGKNIVNYVKVKARDTGLDTITLTQLWNDCDSGAKIAAYAHRFITEANVSGLSDFGQNIPYVSDNSNSYTWYKNQSGICYIRMFNNLLSGIDKPAPDDNGLYACMRPVIAENRRNFNSYPAYYDYMNRLYGQPKNMYRVYGSLAQMLDFRTINAVEYLKINSTLTPNILFRHSTSLS